MANKNAYAQILVFDKWSSNKLPWFFAYRTAPTWAEAISTTMTIVEMAKDIHLQMWIIFIIDVENFLPFG